jgi:hypothetical protein
VLFCCRYEFCIKADAQTGLIPNFVRSALQFRGSEAVALCIGYDVAADGKTATFAVSLDTYRLMRLQCCDGCTYVTVAGHK